jgi:hypothetical protein
MKTSFGMLLLTGVAAGFTFPDHVVKTTTHLFVANQKSRQGYVPKGFFPEEWAAFKAAEKREHSKKKHHFQSRPLAEFQKDLEAGKVRHLFPIMFAKQRVQTGELRPSDVPYEQRQGSYDNKDVNVGYIPSGMTVHEWHNFQRAEKRKLKSKDFGSIGPTSFKSRSLQAFQEDLEKGKVKHLFPTMFAKERVKRGFIKEEDIPYMQRGGSWDNSDLKGAKKLEWTATDYQNAILPIWLRRGVTSA